jgi:hypothetical protein
MAQTVARNRQDLERALSTITSELLKEKGYLCFVDVFIKLGYLSKSDYENWQFKRVSPLERVLSLNLSRINFIMKTVRRNSVNGHLKPSEGVSDLLIRCQRGTPNSYRLMKRPITRSCMVVVLEKQIVRRTNRLIRVRKLMCLLSIFWVFSFPTVCCSASTCRS